MRYERRYRLPNTDLEVSMLCCGTTNFGTALKGEATDWVVSAYLEAGGNFFDTAHCYAFWESEGAGCSERELAASLRRLGALDTVIIASKGGHPPQGASYPRSDYYLGADVVISDIDDSLERLGVERIDLYYLHRDDPRVPVADVLGTLNSEIARGRVGALGASNWSVARIAEANAYAAQHGLHGFIVSQNAGSLAIPNWKIGAEPTMRYNTEEETAWHTASQLPMIPYSASANGYFAGASHSDGGYDNPTNRERRIRARQLARAIGLYADPGRSGLAAPSALSRPTALQHQQTRTSGRDYGGTVCLSDCRTSPLACLTFI